MATSTFSAKALSESGKRTFTTTLFHDNDTWKVLPFSNVDNGAISASASVDADASPIIRVQRIVNGTPVGSIERLFISSLYIDDETVDGVSIAHTGKINQITKATWDNPAYVSDAQATKAVIDAILAIHPDGIITCHRQLAKDSNGNPLKKVTFNGNLRPIVTINWD